MNRNRYTYVFQRYPMVFEVYTWFYGREWRELRVTRGSRGKSESSQGEANTQAGDRVRVKGEEGREMNEEVCWRIERQTHGEEQSFKTRARKTHVWGMC